MKQDGRLVSELLEHSMHGGMADGEARKVGPGHRRMLRCYPVVK